MKKTIIAGMSVAILALATGVWWYNTDMSDGPEAGWKEGDSRLVGEQKTVPKEALVLDVRTPEEYETAHASRAINLPLQDIQAGVMPTPQKDTPLYVYCRSGNRSAEAARLLKNQGYANVTDIGAFANIKKYGL